MYEPMMNTLVVAQRRQQLLREARLRQLRREVLGNRQALHQRWLAMLADLLIAGGTQLKRRYDETKARSAAPAVMDVGWDRL